MTSLKKQSGKIMSLSWVFYFSFPLWAIALGWAEWDWGTVALRPYAEGKLALQALLVGAGIAGALVQPLVKWVWCDVGFRYTRFQAITFSTVLLSLPLVAFSYFWGDVRTLDNAREVTVAIVPAVLLSALIYDQTRSATQWSVSLFSMVFFYLFLVNEILGPFSTYVYLLSHDSRFETLRALIPAFTIAFYFRLHYTDGENSISRINAIHHSWKRSRFAKMFKSTNPGERSLEPKPESGMRH